MFTYQTFLAGAARRPAPGEVWLAGTKYLPVWPSRWLLPVAGVLMIAHLLLRVIARPRARPRRAGRTDGTPHEHAHAVAHQHRRHPAADRRCACRSASRWATVAFVGFWYLRNFKVALTALSDTPFVFAANWELSAIPMFLLMGAIAGNSGIGTGLYRAAYAWFGGLPGGLAVATNWACAGFGAASGSSVAAAATMAKLAVPEMLKHQLRQGARDRHGARAAARSTR